MKFWTKIKFWWWRRFNPARYDKECKKLAIKYALARDRFIWRGTSAIQLGKEGLFTKGIKEELKAFPEEDNDWGEAAGDVYDTAFRLAKLLSVSDILPPFEESDFEERIKERDKDDLE